MPSMCRRYFMKNTLKRCWQPSLSILSSKNQSKFYRLWWTLGQTPVRLTHVDRRFSNWVGCRSTKFNNVVANQQSKAFSSLIWKIRMSSNERTRWKKRKKLRKTKIKWSWSTSMPKLRRRKHWLTHAWWTAFSLRRGLPRLVRCLPKTSNELTLNLLRGSTE